MAQGASQAYTFCLNSQHGLGWFHHLLGDCSKSELDRQSNKPPLGKLECSLPNTQDMHPGECHGSESLENDCLVLLMGLSPLKMTILGELYCIVL